MIGISSLKNKLVYTLLSLFVFSISVNAINDGNRYAKNSVLAKGNWYKIKTPTTGVYKLTYDELKKMGLSNPKNVQVYGYGGEMLDESFSTPYIDDLPQVSLWMSKDPQNFGSGDYILFYAKGDIKWKYNRINSQFEQTQNPYSSDSYYFVTEAEAGPQLISARTATPTGNNVVTTFQDYYLHEKELVNVGETGREYYGENFKGNTSQTFSVSLPGITQDPAKISYNFISKAASGQGTVAISLNGTQIETKKIDQTGANDSYTIAKSISSSLASVCLPENKLNFNYTASGTSDKFIHLNYFRVTYTKTLKPYGGSTPFRSVAIQPSIDFKIAEATSNTLVLDVTNGIKPVKIDGQLSGGTYSFSASNSEIKEYVLVDLAKSIPSPSVEGKVANQNLHGLEVAEMVIIVQPFLRKYAEELAQIHKDDSGLTTLIISPQDIYNEFSSGKPDATAYRRFMKMFYDRATTESEKPRYLLLFGDGSFDNKLITSEWSQLEKRGMLLSFQSTESLSQTSSYTTDDYFGFLDDNEGISFASDKLDLGIGRFPVRTTQEASAVVEKIKRYIRNEEPGIWQNRLCFIADDAIASSHSTKSETAHMVDTDLYTRNIKQSNPEFIIDKVYEDSYERVITANGARYPDAKKAMLDKINSGVLVLNYVGHGSVNDWTHEYILTHPDIIAMNNSKLPLWITATCDFSRFDANATSGGETAFLNSRGGAIALFTTTRVVYIPNNKTLSLSLFKHIFDKEDDMPLRLGDIMKRTKLEIDDSNKLRFVLLGDPALRLSYPSKKYRVEVEEINDIPISNEKVQIQALDNIILKGRIVDSEGNLATDFTGTLESMIYDSEQDLKTRGHVNPSDPSSTPPKPEDIMLNYKDYTNTIFSGKTKIKDGEFEITFVTPKDILYSNGDGKMSFYAYDEDGDKKAQGSFANYTVGGTSPGAIEEFNPPVIKEIYLNNNKFQQGGKTNSTPMFYAHVSDDTGINLASGIGHNISLTVDEKTSYDLTPTFENIGSSSKEGSVRFKIPELSEGKHTLKFKVWDVWNNSQTHDMEFEVVNNYKPSIYDFTLLGNPAKERVIFKFTCDTPESAVNLKYAVYSLTGALKWTHEERGASVGLGGYEYEWDLRGANGIQLTPGVYICRVFISINGEETSKSEKLIIVGQ